jgi:hypothetical protein
LILTFAFITVSGCIEQSKECTEEAKICPVGSAICRAMGFDENWDDSVKPD